MFNFKSRAQSLPLNTIVIAMLVIVVLLVIIVFFTGSLSKSGKTIDDSSSSVCSTSNPVISSLGYIHAEYATSTDGKSCANSNFHIIKIVPSASEAGTICGKSYVKGAVCCGTKTPNTWTCNS